MAWGMWVGARLSGHSARIDEFLSELMKQARRYGRASAGLTSCNAQPRMGFRVLGVVLVVVAGVTGSFRLAAGQLSDSAWRSAQYYGGSDFEFAERLTVDAAGNAYLLGRTFSNDMDAAVVPTAAGSGEPASATFVLKLGRDGQRLYAIPVGAGFGFLPLDIAVGADGAAHALARDGDTAHVIKVAADGSGRAYDVTFNALARDALRPVAIAVDDVGHTVIAGSTPVGVFVARLDARGAVYDVHVLPFAADVRDLAVDAVGDAYLTGAIASASLPATGTAVQPRYSEGACADVFPPSGGGPPRMSPCPDGFLVKLTRSGTVAYATYFGGSGWDEATAVAVDRTGAAVIAGLTRSSNLPTLRALQPQCKPGFAPLACGDAFVAKIDATGTSLIYSTYLGGTDTEGVSGISVDDTGSAFVGGSITGSGMPVLRAPQPASGGGQSDGYVTALAPTGDLLWSTYVGGAAEERIVGVGAAAGIVYFGGETTSPGWAVGGGPHHGARDLFSARVLDLSR
jgi:hypothetical protein